LRHAHRLRVLRKIFGPKGDKGIGEWRRRRHNEKLHHLLSSPSISWVIKSRRMRWAGQVVRTGKKRGAYRAFVGKPERKKPLVRSDRRSDYNNKIYLQEIIRGV
jgi:hypothetical protein